MEDMDPNPPCPICLSSIAQLSYLDKCLHKFCFKCIVQWSKVVSRNKQSSSVLCTLCKIENLAIIHDFDGHSFQKHYIFDQKSWNNIFNLSRAHKYRLQCYYTELGYLDDVFDVSRYWKSRKYLQPNSWLESWLKREIQALLQEEYVGIIMHHILGMIKSVMMRNHAPHSDAKKGEIFQETILDAARPFLTARAGRFVTELELFLASSLNIQAYDAVCLQRLGWSTRGITAEEAVAEEGPVEHRPTIQYFLHILDDLDCSD